MAERDRYCGEQFWSSAQAYWSGIQIGNSVVSTATPEKADPPVRTFIPGADLVLECGPGQTFPRRPE
jgi:hypothetical protein